MHYWKENYAHNYLAGNIADLLLMILILVFAGTFLVSCDGKEKKGDAERAVNVKIALAEKKKVQPYIETTGTLRPDKEVIISSEVDGKIKNITVDEGSFVHPAMVLVEIDETVYRQDEMRSAAALKQAQASLTNVRSDYQRKETLYKEELITKQQFDDATARLALAEAELERAKATLAISREKLAQTKVYSPLQGAVKEKKVTAGDYVRNGTPLLLLIKIDQLKLNFTVGEKDSALVKPGQEVSFTVDAYNNREFKGRVSLLFANVEERTRTMQVEAIVPNGKGDLKAGFFARTFIYTKAPDDAVLIPITALIYDNDSVRIFIIEGDRAREKKVRLGNKYGEQIEIVEGVKEGEQIVVVGQNNLSEGVKVNVAR
ncbi:MAG TPA: efflux RND transporter periplasmic adaptor subunit [Smithellaceae bacterium]|nr:efflux RND transporter periplasmic adaptor subunit [Smithellaceae bacterium]